MSPRPIWSGSISFGLVSVPARMFPATQSQELRFHFVDRRDEFYRWHAAYLILSAVQWLAMLAATWFMLAAWRAEDAKPPETP